MLTAGPSLAQHRPGHPCETGESRVECKNPAPQKAGGETEAQRGCVVEPRSHSSRSSGASLCRGCGRGSGSAPEPLCSVCVCSVMSDSATSGTVARQAPLSMGFSRQEYWSGLPFPSPGDLPNPGIEPRSPALQANSLLSKTTGKPQVFSRDNL